MDGENNGKPYSNGWFGGTPIFGNTHIPVITPWKFNSKFAPENGPFAPKGKDHLPVSSFFRAMLLNFGGVQKPSKPPQQEKKGETKQTSCVTFTLMGWTLAVSSDKHPWASNAYLANG